MSKDTDVKEKDLRVKSHVYDLSETLRAPNRAMLRAVGLSDEDFTKPMIGVASTWSEVTPCNVHIDDLAIQSKKGAEQAGGVPLVFNTITVSDGISMEIGRASCRERVWSAEGDVSGEEASVRRARGARTSQEEGGGRRAPPTAGGS